MMLVYAKSVDWVSEPTSRGYRWLANMPRHTLIVFGVDHPNAGAWCIIAHAGLRPEPLLVAEGVEMGRATHPERAVDAAKLRAVAVYTALTETLTDASGTL